MGGNRGIVLEKRTEAITLQGTYPRENLWIVSWGVEVGTEVEGGSLQHSYPLQAQSPEAGLGLGTKGEIPSVFLWHPIHIPRHILIACIIQNFTH